MSLTTGMRLARQQWTVLPMPEGVIAQVEAMAAQQGEPAIDNDGPPFKWNPGIPIQENPDEYAPRDVDNEGAEQNPPEEIAEYEYDEDLDDEDYGNEDNSVDSVQEAMDEGDIRNDRLYDRAEADIHEDDDASHEDQRSAGGDAQHGHQRSDAEDSLETEDNTSDEEDDSSTQSETGTATENDRRYELRPNRTRDYSHRFENSMDEPEGRESYGSQYLQNSEAN